MQLVYEVILLNKILRNHLLSENMQWNYVSFKVTLNYPMHEIMEFCVTSSLALDNWEQKYCQTLGNKPNIHTVCLEEDYFLKGKFKLFNSLFHSVYLVFPKSLFSIAVRYLYVCNEDKWCVVTPRAAVIRVAWLVYVRTYWVSIVTLNQNKWTRLLYLGDAQLINVTSLLRTLRWSGEYRIPIRWICKGG